MKMQSMNQSTNAISSTNGISSTPTTRTPQSEENEGTGGGREGGREGGRHYRQDLRRRWKKGGRRTRWGGGGRGGRDGAARGGAKAALASVEEEKPQ